MRDCCGCCQHFKPKYRRNIDAVYPPYPNQGAVKSALDKLMHYAIQHPEKLDRIGEYIAIRVQRDISRQRNNDLLVAMEILNALLDACHNQNINMFVSSLLRILEDLLQCSDENVTLKTTELFIAFSRKEEETPSYDRNYKFFVDKFAQMCHSNISDGEKQNKIRVYGIRGLQGVVRKTVSDNLQMNIWDKAYMDKIIPSLLYNMQVEKASETVQSSFIDQNESNNPEDCYDPFIVSEYVFRDVVSRATFGCIQSVIGPIVGEELSAESGGVKFVTNDIAADVFREILGHADLEISTRALVLPTLSHIERHQLWKEFGIVWFKIIMFSVQNQFSYIVVEELIEYLNSERIRTTDVDLRICIVNVLTVIAVIVAKNASPHVNTITKKIVYCLKEIMFSETATKPEELRLHESLVNTIGQFASSTPEYQKSDILIIIMEFVTSVEKEDHPETDRDKVVQFQTVLLKAIVHMMSKRNNKIVTIESMFSKQFCNFAIKLSKSPTNVIRRILQEIFQSLLDRHSNCKKIRRIQILQDLSSLDLIKSENPLKEDYFFMKRSDGGQMLLQIIKDGIQHENNSVDNFKAIFRTLVIICLEVPHEDVFIDVLKIGLEMQDITLKSDWFLTHKCAVHASIAALFNIVAQIADINELIDYVQAIIRCRNEHEIGKCYLPLFAFNRSNVAIDYPTEDIFKDDWQFNKEKISAILKEIDQYDESLLFKPIEVSFIGNDSADFYKSMSDIRSLESSFSIASTPFASRRASVESITVDLLKKSLISTEEQREEKEKEQKRIYNSFRRDDFEKIMKSSCADKRSQEAQTQLSCILDDINKQSLLDDSTLKIDDVDIRYPELFVFCN